MSCKPFLYLRVKREGRLPPNFEVTCTTGMGVVSNCTVLWRLSLLLLAITRLRGNLGQNSSPKTVPQCNSTQTDPVLMRGLKMANRSVGLNEHAHKQKY